MAFISMMTVGISLFADDFLWNFRM